MDQEAIHINRLDVENDIDFEIIRKEGIRLLQELSGKIWTDYNAHDPGLTILEQLIYALTEIIYLTDFDVKDFLTSDDGEIKYNGLALYKPLAVFPSETITAKDYCKTIFDNIEGVRNTWTIDNESNKNKGLYVFLIDIEWSKKDNETEIINSVRKYFNANRNLCEDIARIEVLKREPLEIYATIDINNNRSPEEIMADILFACFKVISPRMTLHSYHDLMNSDFSLDEILSGPEMVHGFIKDDEMPMLRPQIFVSELMKEVFQVKGVESIVDFYVAKEGKKIRGEINFSRPGIAAYIKFPQHKDDVKINLLRNDRVCTINVPEMLRMFYSSYHAYKSIFNTSQDIAELSNLPKGKYVNFENYYSIQNHFPAIYGINQFGIPGSATPERKAKAKQLKAYLLLFEQIIGNCLSQMENIKELFSIDQDKKYTYFTQALTNIPDIREVLTDEWKDDKQLQEQQLGQILAKYDNYYERKNRVLDFILAMYGERFTYKTFQQFNYYYPVEELPRIICENKIILLKNLIKINRYKARSFNYQVPSWNTENVPMIKMKVSLLLGIQDYSQVTYSDVLANYDLGFFDESGTSKCDDCIYKQKDFNIELDDDYISEHFRNITAYHTTEESGDYPLKDILKDIVYLKDGRLCEDFFRYGINISSYKIGKLKHKKEYTVVFKHPKYGRYIYISDFKDRYNGVLAIHRLHNLFVKLNQQSEGMHIVEHMLLRQENAGYITGYQIINDDDEPIFSSTDDFISDEGGNVVEELSGILTNHENYIAEENPEGGISIEIVNDDKKIFKGNQKFESAEVATIVIEKYVEYFKSLYEMEIFHERVKASKRSVVPPGFFPFRISVILPSWSARFNNNRFRDYLEETFRLNLPAHIYPEFYWLNIRALNHFEKLYQNWLKAKSMDDTEKTDEHAGRLIRFLIGNRPKQQNQYD